MCEWYQSDGKLQNIITQRKNIVFKINADKLEEGDRGKQTKIGLIFYFDSWFGWWIKTIYYGSRKRRMKKKNKSQEKRQQLYKLKTCWDNDYVG